MVSNIWCYDVEENETRFIGKRDLESAYPSEEYDHVRKRFSAFQSRINISLEDLGRSATTQFEARPVHETTFAAVYVPSRIFWGKAVGRKSYSEICIVAPKSPSARASPESSPCHSRVATGM